MELYCADRTHDVHGAGPFRLSNGDAGVLDQDIATAARAARCVLLTGPSVQALAVGRRIHEESGRRDRPFTVVECGTRSSEITDRVVEALGGGTLYLQNVGRMPLEVQRAVARLLAEPGRGRIMASTAEPLLSRVLDGEFDDCLYYRLNVIHVVIPDGHSPRIRTD